jgi:hypothetical protein
MKKLRPILSLKRKRRWKKHLKNRLKLSPLAQMRIGKTRMRTRSRKKFSSNLKPTLTSSCKRMRNQMKKPRSKLNRKLSKSKDQTMLALESRSK